MQMLEAVRWLLSMLPSLTTEEAATLQGYAGAIQAIFSVVGTLLSVVGTGVAAVAVVVARRAWLTSQHQRFDAQMPLFTAHLVGRAGGNNVAGFEYRLENIGLGPALSVRVGITVPPGRISHLVPDNRRKEQPYDVLIAPGQFETFEFLDDRLLRYDESIAALRRSLGSNFSSNLTQDEYNQRWSEIRNPILADAFDFEVRTSYQDVYGRKFVVCAQLVQTSNNRYTENAASLEVGRITHQLPVAE